MKFKAKRKELLKGLKAINAAKGSAFVSASVSNAEAVLSGFGQNLAVRATVPIEINAEESEDKSLGFNADIIISALSAADDEDVAVDIGKSSIYIKSKSLSFRAPAKSGSKPQLAAGSDNTVVRKDVAASFPLFVKKVEHASEAGNTPILHSVNICVYDDKSIRVVCTDGRRISARGNIKASDPNLSVAIDRADADAMLSALSGKVEFLSVGQSFVLASFGNVSVAVRTLSATFPDWESLVFSKRKEAGRIEMPRGEFLSACQLCGLVSDAKSGYADFSSQGVRLSASGEYGNAENTIAAKGQIAGGTVTQKFDMIFMSDALRSLSDENVMVSVAPSQALIVTDSEGFEMVMPQRIR